MGQGTFQFGAFERKSNGARLLIADPDRKNSVSRVFFENHDWGLNGIIKNEPCDLDLDDFFHETRISPDFIFLRPLPPGEPSPPQDRVSRGPHNSQESVWV